MDKALFGWPSWKTVPPRRVKNPSTPIDSSLAEKEVLLVTLADPAMNVLEALQLRITTWKGRSNFDVTATLEAEGSGWTCISRMDFWPPSGHPNKFWRKLGQPPFIDGSHHHCFHDNRRLGMKTFKPNGNLDSAKTFDAEPSSFRDILGLIERHWKIAGACDLQMPERQGSLW